ncbi:hypothetical protein K402DRAFT_405706 [Aulographum hederae CBS 113979]|uniref:Uncharacterized protein n=1 Tax=Aulographum hederae CBS 113979 TaxID=1176131 RepID=A0A6G1GVE6_9PEZI|nr:hypothetical protein K402DRAFT_405706 [Aulographum hederae CBS 113979]
MVRKTIARAAKAASLPPPPLPPLRRSPRLSPAPPPAATTTSAVATAPVDFPGTFESKWKASKCGCGKKNPGVLRECRSCNQKTCAECLAQQMHLFHSEGCDNLSSGNSRPSVGRSVVPVAAPAVVPASVASPKAGKSKKALSAKMAPRGPLSRTAPSLTANIATDTSSSPRKPAPAASASTTKPAPTATRRSTRATTTAPAVTPSTTSAAPAVPAPAPAPRARRGRPPTGAAGPTTAPTAAPAAPVPAPRARRGRLPTGAAGPTTAPTAAPAAPVPAPRARRGRPLVAAAGPTTKAPRGRPPVTASAGPSAPAAAPVAAPVTAAAPVAGARTRGATAVVKARSFVPVPLHWSLQGAEGNWVGAEPTDGLPERPLGHKKPVGGAIQSIAATLLGVGLPQAAVHVGLHVVPFVGNLPAVGPADEPKHDPTVTATSISARGATLDFAAVRMRGLRAHLLPPRTPRIDSPPRPAPRDDYHVMPSELRGTTVLGMRIPYSMAELRKKAQRLDAWKPIWRELRTLLYGDDEGESIEFVRAPIWGDLTGVKEWNENQFKIADLYDQTVRGPRPVAIEDLHQDSKHPETWDTLKDSEKTRTLDFGGVRPPPRPNALVVMVQPRHNQETWKEFLEMNVKEKKRTVTIDKKLDAAWYKQMMDDRKKYDPANGI